LSADKLNFSDTVVVTHAVASDHLDFTGAAVLGSGVDPADRIAGQCSYLFTGTVAVSMVCKIEALDPSITIDATTLVLNVQSVSSESP
jgi:hypothetical protein